MLSEKTLSTRNNLLIIIRNSSSKSNASTRYRQPHLELIRKIDTHFMTTIQKVNYLIHMIIASNDKNVLIPDFLSLSRMEDHWMFPLLGGDAY